MSSQANYKTIFLVFAAVCVIWGILGIMDSSNYTYSGYSTDGDNTIIEVEEDSPAEAAGFQIGDKIKSVGGIAVEDTKARNRRNRAEIGEARTYVMDRDGAEESLDLTFAAQTSRGKVLNWLATLIGFLFIFFGVRAYLNGPKPATLLFGIFGLCFGYSFMGGPYFDSNVVRDVVGIISLPIILISFAALLHFMLSYPKKRAFLDKTLNVRLIYAPAILLSLFILALIILQPDSTSGLNQIMRLLFGLFFLFYFGWSLLAMVQNYNKASAEERTDYGLNLMLWGTVIGLVPVLIVMLINTVAPQLVIPGSRYVFLLIGIVPIAYGLALDKGLAAAT